MADFHAEDVAVVIPTHRRAGILDRTVSALVAQTASGFDVVVVVDGDDQAVGPLPVGRVLNQPHRGPAAARNFGVDQSDRPLVLLLGDDIIPTPGLVAAHLDAHNRHPSPEVAVLGHTEWHADVATWPHNRWLDWSRSQFDYASIDGDRAQWWHLYSSNVSLKRPFFLASGGFDEDFHRAAYEDIDLGYRLSQRGLDLRYNPAALAHHLHGYDWTTLTRRWHTTGVAERQMSRKHEWFQPFFHDRARRALGYDPVSPLWPALARRSERVPTRLRRVLEERTNGWYDQQLSAPFLGGWFGPDDERELREYLGAGFQEAHLREHTRLVDEEEERAADEAEFYRTSEMYLYDLTMFSAWGTKQPYLAALRRLVPAGSRLLDYGCGIGTDGLRLIDEGYRVEFADFDNPSTRYLRWRLARRRWDTQVYDVEGEVPGGFDAAYSFDVIEHVDDPWAFLAQLERRARVVMVNLLEHDPTDTHLHRPLPVAAIVRHAAREGLLFYHRYQRRSHLLAYATDGRVSRAQSLRCLVDGAVDVFLQRLTGLPESIR